MSEAAESAVHIAVALAADTQAVEVVQPAEGALNPMLSDQSRAPVS
jgi:hypothetical protein